MQIFHGIQAVKQAPKHCIATIGNFDGVHRGHRAIIEKVVARAKSIGGTAVVITFQPHPHVVLMPQLSPYLLNLQQEKQELLAATGVDWLIEEPFSREFSNTTPEQFVDQYLVKKLQLQVLYLGYDFAFGKERAGSVQVLEKLAKARKIEIHVEPPLLLGKKPISSSFIRKLLDEAQIEQANQCLGRTFFIRGHVVRGEGRGKKLGFPTANLKLELRKLPKLGVYITKTKWRGREFSSVTNVGKNPTFHVNSEAYPVIVETHILDFNADLYGETLDIEFYKFLRDEKKFSSVDELIQQIKLDADQAKIFWQN